MSKRIDAYTAILQGSRYLDVGKAPYPHQRRREPVAAELHRIPLLRHRRHVDKEGLHLDWRNNNNGQIELAHQNRTGGPMFQAAWVGVRV